MSLISNPQFIDHYYVDWLESAWDNIMTSYNQYCKKYTKSDLERVQELANRGYTRIQISETLGIPEGTLATFSQTQGIVFSNPVGRPRKATPPKKYKRKKVETAKPDPFRRPSNVHSK